MLVGGRRLFQKRERVKIEIYIVFWVLRYEKKVRAGRGRESREEL